MSQKLIVPFVKSMILCGYKNARYKEAWGYPHYGIDLSSIQGNAGSNHSIFASGEGTVLAAGKDDSLGYGAAILYKDCIERYGSTKCDIVARYMHMSALNVKAGDKVTVETKIGTEGKEGTEDYHLHFEFDTDTTPKYATWSPQVSKGHTFWKKGTDSTLNPSLWLWQDEGRILVTPTYNPAWLNTEDKNIPTLVSEKETAATPIAYDEDECEDYFGEPAWAWYDKEVNGYKLFDKWWRAISTETYPSAGYYADEKTKKKAKAYTGDIKEKYKEPNDIEGKAGIKAAAASEKKETAETVEQIPIAYDEEECEDYYGDPVWYVYDKELTVYYFFDKWWRKVSTDTSPGAGRYASDEEKKKAKAWNAGIPEKYFEATDPEGKAGFEDAAGSADQSARGEVSGEVAALRAAITEYETEKAKVINRLRELIEMLEK